MPPRRPRARVQAPRLFARTGPRWDGGSSHERPTHPWSRSPVPPHVAVAKRRGRRVSSISCFDSAAQARASLAPRTSPEARDCASEAPSRVPALFVGPRGGAGVVPPGAEARGMAGPPRAVRRQKPTPRPWPVCCSPVRPWRRNSGEPVGTAHLTTPTSKRPTTTSRSKIKRRVKGRFSPPSPLLFLSGVTTFPAMPDWTVAASSFWGQAPLESSGASLASRPERAFPCRRRHGVGPQGGAAPGAAARAGEGAASRGAG